MVSTGKYLNKAFRLTLIVLTLAGLFFFIQISTKVAANNATTRVAFTADQGYQENAQLVLQLIADEQADLLLIQGDFGYDDGVANLWAQNLDSILGDDFPVLGVVGNHENFEWPVYQSFLSNRIDALPGLVCTGDIGVKALCRFRGIEIVQVAPGISEVPTVLPDDDYAQYITESFQDSTALWRICSWHKNHELMQAGGNASDVPLEVYQACSEQGAIVATGHEHLYSRTVLMSDFENQTIVDIDDDMVIRKGQSIAFVSALGGHSIRGQLRFDPWWASVHSATQGATYGALFCDFSGRIAQCYYKDITGEVHDTFVLQSEVIARPPRSLKSILDPILKLLFE